MGFDLLLMEKYLQRAIDEFDSTPLATQLMRRLATENPDLFFTVAMEHLDSNEQSNALRLMAILVLRQDTLLDRITSPAYSNRETAVNLFRRFLSVDPSFDVKLARKLPGRTYWNQAEAFDSVHSTRALDILDETSRGRRLLPILGHLPESNDSRVSAKATLFVGRRVQNASWTARQLARSDQRVRANAVEALWGVKEPAAVRILEDCLKDKNNRVIGNSLVGLHIVGRETVGSELLGMSRMGKAEARSTAAWAMGQIGLPPFLERLTELVRDDHPQVRGMAIRSLLAMRRMEQKVTHEQAPENAAVVLEQAQKLLAETPVEIVPTFSGANYSVRRG